MRLLVAYSGASTHTQTTLDYLMSFGHHGGFEVRYVHVTHGSILDVDVNEFDVIFHNYCARMCFEGYVSEHYVNALQNFRGLKVAAAQDEYDLTNVLKSNLKRMGFHVFLTCVPPESWEFVYPKSELPHLHLERVLTGYVPDEYAVQPRPHRSLSERPIVVGYRARALPAYYGVLGYEKYEIGRRMQAICEARGIAHDISMDDSRRILGGAWFDFVGACRAMIGSESGSNLFDWDGSLKARYNAISSEKGRPATYEEFLPHIETRDQEVSMGQISPRVFECAVMRTPMILFRGRYSDAIEPDLHYIPLEKDFSNIDEVLTRLEDLPSLEAMAERAYEHLVASGKFGYRAFAERLRRLFAEQRERLGMDGTRESGSAFDKRPRTLEQALLLEAPTSTPYSAEVFQRRFDLTNLPVFLGELKRLEAILRDEDQLYRREMEHLISTLEGTRANLGDKASEADRQAEAALREAAGRLTATIDRALVDAAANITILEEALPRLVAEGLSLPERLDAGAELLGLAKASVERVNAEIMDANAAFTALARQSTALIQMMEIVRVRTALWEQHAVCLPRARSLRNGSFDRRAGPTDVLAPLPFDAIEAAAARSREADAAYERLIKRVMPGDLLPEATSEIFGDFASAVQDRLLAVNAEITEFLRIYTEITTSAHLRISRMQALLGRSGDQPLPLRVRLRVLLGDGLVGQLALRVLRRAARAFKSQRTPG